MSSPIVNLNKTNMTPEKIINGYNGTLIKSRESKKNLRSIEEEVDDIRNFPNEMEKEKLMLLMSHRMSNLENEVKDVREEFYKAVSVINRKDAEIEMLKKQLLLQGQQQTNPHISVDNEIAEMTFENEYLKEQYGSLTEAINNMSSRNGGKGDIYSEDGDDRSKYRSVDKMFEKERREYSLYEEMDESLPINNKLKKRKSKKFYEDGIDKFKNESLEMEKLLADRVDNYIEDLSSSSSISSLHERSNKTLESEYLRLADQISEMENFLADYGMIWVGEQKVTDEKLGDRIIQKTVGFSPDFEKVIMIIGELNERVSSENHIKVTGNEAKFQKADMLNLTLYKDGIQLEDNPFREYSRESVKAFFQDLEDGYYPTELKESHPNGVIFKVADKRNMSYDEAEKKEILFRGPGYRLGTRESSDEEPSVEERHSKQQQPGEYLEANENFVKQADSQKEADDIHVSLKSSFEDNHISTSESRHDGLRNITSARKDSFEHIEKREKVASTKSTAESKEVVYHEQEAEKSLENKVTQTEKDIKPQNVQRRSLETQTNELKGDLKNDTEMEIPIHRYRDKIEITNITYHEAPSSPELPRYITIGPLESQSEPAIGPNSSTSYQYNPPSGYPPQPRRFRQQQKQFAHRERDLKRNDDGGELKKLNSGGSEDSENVPFMTSEYNDNYGQNAQNLISTILSKKKFTNPIIAKPNNVNTKYEHITFLGSSTDVQEGTEKEKESKGNDRYHSKESIENDNEIKVIPLNVKTSDGQIELNMRSHSGNEIFSAYLYPDDTIGKIWNLTKLNSNKFEVTVDDKVLDLNIPLKNYNIDGDVTLNISKKKLNAKNEAVTQDKPQHIDTTIEEIIDSPDEDDDVAPEISKLEDEGYSS